jgi:hypothetical protein
MSFDLPIATTSHEMLSQTGVDYFYKARDEAVAGSADMPQVDTHCHNEDGYDDGLVHSHGWARGG